MGDECAIAEAPELGGGSWPAMEYMIVRPPPSFPPDGFKLVK